MILIPNFYLNNSIWIWHVDPQVNEIFHILLWSLPNFVTWWLHLDFILLLHNHNKYTSTNFVNDTFIFYFFIIFSEKVIYNLRSRRSFSFFKFRMKTERVGPILNFDKIFIYVQIIPRVCRVKINKTRNDEEV